MSSAPSVSTPPIRPSRVDASTPPSLPPALPQLPYAPLSATVDDMLDWMRERQRAAKRYQEAVHQQWVQKAPPAGGGVPHGSPSSARRSTTLRSTNVGRDAVEGALTPYRGVSVDSFAHDIGHGVAPVTVASSDVSLVVPLDAAEASGATLQPGGQSQPQHQLQHDAHLLALTRFENEGLQRRIAELRAALSAAVGAIERQHADATGLKRRIRVLEQHLRDREVVHQMAVDSLVGSSTPLSERSATEETVADRSHDASLWWTADPFTEEENAVIQDIVQRHGGKREDGTIDPDTRDDEEREKTAATDKSGDHNL